MSTKAKIITAYLGIGLLYAIYATNWGANANRGFFFNLGGGFIWPLVMFPGLGKAVGTIILLIFIVGVIFS